MSFLALRKSGAVEIASCVKQVSYVRRTIGASPHRAIFRGPDPEQCAAWRYIHGRSIDSYRPLDSKQNQCAAHGSVGLRKNHSIEALVRNRNHRYCIHTQRLFATGMKGKEDEDSNINSNSTYDEEKTNIQMPDRDTELRLVDLQASINEEYKRGNFKQALVSSQDYLKETQQHFGYNVDHPATASAMNNVGLMHKLQGNFTEARQHYVAAMRIYASVCGRDHASYAMTLHNLGNLNKSQVHFDTSLKATERLSLVESAMEFLEEAYAIRVAELGGEHPHTVATRSAIGSTLAAQVLYQHKLVEETHQIGEETAASSSSSTRKQYVALDPEGITQQQWRAAEEHLRESLQTAIDNPRGKQIQSNRDRRWTNKGKRGKGKRQQQNNNKERQLPSGENGGIVPSSSLFVKTLSAASAAQNLAVFLKSLAMTFDEDSSQRREHMLEAKDLYEKVQRVRSQLLPYNHPDLYATKYSLAELLEVLGSSGGKGSESEEDDLERQRHQEAANALRQEIINTYDPPDAQPEEGDGDSSEEEQPGPIEVLVEKTEASTK